MGFRECVAGNMERIYVKLTKRKEVKKELKKRRLFVLSV
jgi:hypothetical protein